MSAWGSKIQVDVKGKEIKIPETVMMIVERLRSRGYDAFVVGGAVRDLVMGRPVTDWDVATSARKDKIITLFRDMRHFHLKHETVTLVLADRTCEVTPFRGGGKNEASNLEADLSHRDFTINAMAFDPEHGKLYDPFEGRNDIRRRQVRAVGEPEERFREDPLRMLRSVRLAAELGFAIDPATFLAVSHMAEQIQQVAAERIREELMKILLSPKPSSGFNLMRRSGLLREILPELAEGVGRWQNRRHHRYTIFRHVMETLDRVDPEPVLRLTALLHDIAKPRMRKKVDGRFHFHGHEEASGQLARQVMVRLRFSNETTDRVTHLVANHMRDQGYDSGWSDGAVRRLLRDVGEKNIEPFLAFRKADLLAHGMGEQETAGLRELQSRIALCKGTGLPQQVRELAIGGHRVMEILDIPPGPEVGRVLGLLMERVLDEPDLNTEPCLSTVLKAMKSSEKTGVNRSRR